MINSLSGVVFLQAVLYWQMYPYDPKKTKAVVSDKHEAALNAF